MHKFVPKYLILLLSVLLTQTGWAQVPAFPGAEGFGMHTTGGRGGRLIKVTNLNDSGEGSLRAAIEASGPRIVIFEVSGTIALESKLYIRNDDITIAGQTAPGDGICVKNYCVYITASNVIIRYMRFRMGDEAQQVDDALGGQGSRNMIIDHCSMSWSIDECASFYANENFTMQWCLMTESLRNSFHEGSHGFGGIWGGNRASFHHNLLTHHSNRNPRFRGNKINRQTDVELVDFRNNVIYNYAGTSYGSEGGGSYNFVNNYYKYGPASGNINNKELLHVNVATAEYNWLELEGAHGIFYVNGNYMDGNETVNKNNWDGGITWDIQTNIERVKSEVEFEKGNITTDDAATAYERVLEYAGASLVRDTVDKRAIHDTRTRTASVMDGGNGSTNGYIDTQEAVGGWPVLNSLPAPTDTDGDGMPDDWELANGLNPNNPDDGNGDRDNDLYTNIEEYINSLALDYYNTKPIINVVKPQNNEVFIASADTSIYVEAYSNDYNGGFVEKMELYLDNLLVSENSDSAKIITTLENITPGIHHLTIKSTDNTGNVTVDKTTIYVGSKKVQINVEESPNGRVKLEPSGGVYSEGVLVKATAIPAEGYLFEGWINDIETSRNDLQITTAKDITLKAIFVKDSEKRNIWSYPIKINFQPEEDYTVPESYIPDYGGAYSKKWTGYSYGWIDGYNPSYGLNISEPGVWKTFRHFEKSGKTYTWAIDLPKGIYKIRLGLGGKLLLGLPTETELKLNVEDILVEDNDGVDLLDEHILDSIPVMDGQLTLTSVEQSRICFIEIELLELVSSKTLTVENGGGGGEYYPDLGEKIKVVADTPPDGQVFEKWIGDTTFLDDIYSSTTFAAMPDTNVFITATYKNAKQDTAYFLVVVNGTGSGYYTPGNEIQVSAKDTLGGGIFSHWEYDCTSNVSFDSQSSRFSFSMPDASIVLEPVYKMPSSGEGDIYQAEEATRDEASKVERNYPNYYGLGYVNFGNDEGSYVQYNNIDGKDGENFIIKIRYSLNDKARQGIVIINGVRDTITMTTTKSWSEWSQLEVFGALVAGSNNTIRIETTGDDLGYIDQIEIIKSPISKTDDYNIGPAINVRCFPNPFEDYVTISFELIKPSDVMIQLYDLHGKLLKVVDKNIYPAGLNQLTLGKDNLKPGLYILRLSSNQSKSNIKVLIV
jgi:hypothetical protein